MCNKSDYQFKPVYSNAKSRDNIMENGGQGDGRILVLRRRHKPILAVKSTRCSILTLLEIRMSRQGDVAF
jgi:hypothetical protein